MRKTVGAIFILLCSLVFTSVASAVNPSLPERPISTQLPGLPELPELPDVSGTYIERSNPLVRVRVFIHKERPQTATNSLLVCDLPDPDSSTEVSAEVWHLPSNVSYSLNVNSTPSSVGLVNLPTIVSNSFNDWVGASGNKVSFNRGSDTSKDRSSFDFKNIVAFGRTSGSALGVTYIRYYTATGLVADVDSILNKRVSWSWSNSSTCADPNSYDAENIMEHELGHWLGLDDEYDATLYQNATMYGYGSRGEVKKATLSTGDSTGAFNIYNP